MKKMKKVIIATLALMLFSQVNFATTVHATGNPSVSANRMGEAVKASTYAQQEPKKDESKKQQPKKKHHKKSHHKKHHKTDHKKEM